MNTKPNIYIHAAAGICAIGQTTEQITLALLGNTPANQGASTSQYSLSRSVFLGQIHDDLRAKINEIKAFKSRNNTLLLKTLSEISDEWKAAGKGINPDKMAVIIGSSNAGIEEGENAMAHHNQYETLPEQYTYEQQEYGSPAKLLAHQLGITGPAYTISTACSSGAKAFISAARLLEAKICDIAIVGGSDVLSQLTVNGFLALEAIDGERSQPFTKNRKGIHLGEAAALFVLSREPSAIRLAGWGESSDAHHMAAPHPEGAGAETSMRAALAHASLNAEDIDYINLHGTATIQNDAMESQAVSRVFGLTTPVSSTKSQTGHTLGAAGAIEALFCYLTLKQTRPPYHLPVHWVRGSFDDSLPALNFVQPASPPISSLQYILSNSFGFGGSNASLIFARSTS